MPPLTTPATDPPEPWSQLLGRARAAAQAQSDEAVTLRAQVGAVAAQYPDGSAQLDFLDALAAFGQGRYAEARALGERARVGFHAAGAAPDPAETLLGNIALERADYAEALARYTEAVRSADERGDEAAVGRLYNNIGLVAWRTRDLPRAEECFTRALRLLEPSAVAALLGNIHNNLGLVYEERGDVPEAEAAYLRAIEALGSGSHPVFLANALANLADLRESQGGHQASISLNERALDLREHAGHRRGIVGSRLSLARLALAVRDLPAAEAQVAAARALAVEMGLQKHEADTWALESRTAELGGDLPRALRAEREAAARRESHAGEEMRRRVAELQSRLQTAEARRTAERQAQEREELLSARLEAEAASEAKSEFLGVMSHEMRTPLTSVLGAATLLAQSALDDRQRRHLEVIRIAAEALLATINDVLDFSRLDAGALPLEPQPTELPRVLREVESVVEGSARALGLGLVVDLPVEPPPPVMVDGVRLRQVLLNLATNAVKFTPFGRVTLRLRWSEGVATFEVADTGVGVDPELIPRLFRPFTQADTSTTRRFRGTGLGLAVSSRLVSAMGGTISVDSTPGQGSTFTVAIPLPRVGELAAAGPGTDAGNDVRVLLVEDDDLVAEVVSQLLEISGATVGRCAGGAEALEALAANPYDLVFLDAHMPAMDGFEVARQIRARGGPGPRIVGLSGASSGEDRARGRQAGMDAWLAKPVTLDQLREEVDRARGPRGD